MLLFFTFQILGNERDNIITYIGIHFSSSSSFLPVCSLHGCTLGMPNNSVMPKVVVGLIQI